MGNTTLPLLWASGELICHVSKVVLFPFHFWWDWVKLFRWTVCLETIQFCWWKNVLLFISDFCQARNQCIFFLQKNQIGLIFQMCMNVCMCKFERQRRSGHYSLSLNVRCYLTLTSGLTNASGWQFSSWDWNIAFFIYIYLGDTQLPHNSFLIFCSPFSHTVFFFPISYLV